MFSKFFSMISSTREVGGQVLAKRVVSTIDIYVGRRIRYYRTLSNMSQQKLAEHLDITFQQVQKYENGTNRISAGRLFQVAKFFNVPISDFFPKWNNSHKLRILYFFLYCFNIKHLKLYLVRIKIECINILIYTPFSCKNGDIYKYG